MPRPGFHRLNRRRTEQGRPTFANPRNAAAGIIRQLEPRQVADKPLTIVVYELMEMSDDPPETHHEMLARFPEWGLRTHDDNRRARTAQAVADYHRTMVEARDTLDHEVDGITIKCDRYADRDALGMRARNPRWALAWKFPPRREVTRLRDIVVQVGRTGKLTPVALLDPVDVGGVTVSRATLHNESEVHRKDVRIGDQVRIQRAGDVIPEVVGRVDEAADGRRGRSFAMPGACPSCGTDVVQEGAYTVCPNGLGCTAQLKGRIVHYASRDALDIEDLGEKTAHELVGRGMVTDIADLYALDIDDLKTLERFAERSATKLHDAIHGTDQVRTDRFLYALGIRHVGKQVAKVVAGHFGSFDTIRQADTDQLQAVRDIGTETAKSLARFFAQDTTQDVLDRIAAAGVRVTDMPRRKEQPLAGQTFVFTGALDDFTRDEAKEAVESLGARATTSVSGNTDHVVIGHRPGSKKEEAEAHGVQTLDEDAFKRLVEKARDAQG